MKKPKPKFRVGQVVYGGGRYFKISEIMKHFDDPRDENKLTGFLYREVWTRHPEKELRPLTRKEAGM